MCLIFSRLFLAVWINQRIFDTLMSPDLCKVKLDLCYVKVSYILLDQDKEVKQNRIISSPNAHVAPQGWELNLMNT